MTISKGLAAIAAGVSCIMASSAFAAPVVVENGDANALADLLIGTGINRVGDATLTIADSAQAGTFTGGGADVGLDTGVTLSSGNINNIGGTNTGDLFSDNDFTATFGGAGDADLSTIVGGSATFDAAVLEFDFEFDGGVGGDLFFSFVFGSEEYLEFVGSAFNDVFGFFVDGVNVATIGTDPISVNSVNNVSNSSFYIDNPVAAPAVDLVVDGLTTAIVISVLDLAPGTHSMKFAIADTSDQLLDSIIFIGGGSFSSEPPTEIPVPAALPLMLAGLVGLRFASRRKKA